MEPGITVSHVARLHGIQSSLLFKWKKQYLEGNLTAVAAEEDVIPVSDLAAAIKQIKELQCLLGKKTMEVEILKEAVEYGQSRKWIAHAPLVANGQGITLVSRILGVSRAQLAQRMKTSGNKPNKHRRRCDEAADAEVLTRILDIISDMPTYGYCRVWAILRRQSRNEGLLFVNAKRVYRIMSVLLHDKPSRP